jgi:hypothetical protein
VLTSDANGLASWKYAGETTTVYASGVIGGVANAGYVPKFDPSGVGISPSLFYETGGMISLSSTPTSPMATLDINGTLRIR